MSIKKFSPPSRLILELDKEASKSNQYRAKMGAMITTLVFPLKAYNYNIFDGRNRNNKNSIHAEEHLIAKAAKRGVSLKGHTIIVYRKKKNGCGTSRPCAVCKELLKKVGISKVIYYDGTKWVLDNSFI